MKPRAIAPRSPFTGHVRPSKGGGKGLFELPSIPRFARRTSYQKHRPQEASPFGKQSSILQGLTSKTVSFTS